MIRTALNSFITTLTDFGAGRDQGPEKRDTAGRPSAVRLTIVGYMSGSSEDGRALADIGSRSGWQVVFAETYAQAKSALDQASVPVVLCDRDLLGMGWRTAMERLAAHPRRACVILLSETVDTYLFNEVIRGGGYDVLPKPLREEGVVRIVRLARSYWNSPARKGVLSRELPPSRKGTL